MAFPGLRLLQLTDDESILKRLLVTRVTDVDEALAAIDEIKPKVFSGKVHLVIIDNVCIPFRTIYADSIAERTRMIRSFGLKLRELVSGTTILTTNHLTSRFSEDGMTFLVPALGESWAVMCDLDILLEPRKGGHWALLIMRSEYQEYKQRELFFQIKKRNALLYTLLFEADPEIYSLIEKEKQRQFHGLELIASENYTSVAVMEANGSILTNKYSEGLPGARYYAGNEHIDEIERLCQRRALAAFRLSEDEWGVNVQPYSGSPANFAALTGLVGPHDRIMGLDLPSGGHLTHGYQTSKKKISATSIFFESLPYQVDPMTGLIDYEKLAENARLFHPKVLICGASAYPREWDYVRLRKIADEHGAYLMMDMAHISGLVAAQEAADPFALCDVVTTTTHKTLRGPRAGLIFFRKKSLSGEPTGLEDKINFAVFPSTQGGPHNNTIAAIAVALKQAATSEFRQYAVAVRENARVLAEALHSYGYRIATDGTDNHIVLWDLRPLKLTGSKVEKICEMVHITVNKNSVPGDQSAVSPGGVRLGTAALTSRGFCADDFIKVAQMLHKAVQISVQVQNSCPSKLLKDFIVASQNNPDIKSLAVEVDAFSAQFPMPGV